MQAPTEPFQVPVAVQCAQLARLETVRAELAALRGQDPALLPNDAESLVMFALAFTRQNLSEARDNLQGLLERMNASEAANGRAGAAAASEPPY